jgi:exopolyphosphatase / guanosine-5'-triphosphate,3'-diphosphate pyrophosphatase
MSKICAIADLGTNTFQLLISPLDGFQVLDHLQRPVGLGMGAMEQVILQEDAMDRALVGLHEFVSLFLSKGGDISDFYAIGTSILRRASNAGAFIQRVKEELGVSILVIDGIQEAEYIYAGIRNSLPKRWEKTSLVMDIGGGSVEFILFKGNEVLYRISLELGGLRLKSLFSVNNEFDLSVVAGLDAHVSSEMRVLFQVCKKEKPEVLIGAAGAFETILDLENRSSQAPASCEIDLKQFLQHKLNLDEMPYQERVAYPGMKAFRASIFPYATFLIEKVLRELGLKELWFSSYSLKEGFWFTELSTSQIQP